MDGWIYGLIAVVIQAGCGSFGRRQMTIATVRVACLPILLACSSGYDLLTTTVPAPKSDAWTDFLVNHSKRTNLAYSRYFLTVSLQALAVILAVHAFLRWQSNRRIKLLVRKYHSLLD